MQTMHVGQMHVGDIQVVVAIGEVLQHLLG
jgi:hypothetical protein